MVMERAGDSKKIEVALSKENQEEEPRELNLI